MSKVGQWRIELQERPEYLDGWHAAQRGEIRHCFILSGEAREAWMLGYDDCRDDMTARPDESAS